jgi:hypothetical protein
MENAQSKSALRRRAAVAGVGAAALVGAFMLPAQANLPGSGFEGNDGNFVVTTAGNTDWVNAPNRVIGTDLINSQQDNSFGQGTSENDTTVTVVTGSIPNSKADLSQFLVASEQAANTHTYLYLGWTRANQSGTTNFDFEINKLAQPDLTTVGSKTLNRSTGDLLINYLFQGQGTPQIQIRTWTGTVWTNPVSGVVAEAAINTASLANPFGAPNPLPAGQFGETAIDLTASGIIPSGVCEGFSSAYVKSRASTSFTSEVKDFVAPQHVNISTCASITVVKQTVPSPDPTNTAFAFVASYDAGGFSLTNGGTNESGPLVPGTYSVNETPVPANWTLTSATCDDGSPISAIVLSANEHVTCTFVNTLQQGAIEVTKTRKHAADGPGQHPQAGVSFTVNGVTKATDSNGKACFDSLDFGSYDVTETVPAGYVADGATTKSVTVDNAAKCTDNPYVGETVSFQNTPLTNITASVDSQVDGATASTIVCKDANNVTVASGSTGANGDGSATATDLQPGTYTCTIVVDP